MGRRPKYSVSNLSTTQCELGCQVLLPKTAILPLNSHPGQEIPETLSLRVENCEMFVTRVLGSEMPPPATTPQKVLLPKLPPGVKPPSKIIVINTKDPSQPKVQVLNTSGAGFGYSDEERKMKMLTGKLQLPKNILPKPQPLVLRRPKSFFLPGTTSDGFVEPFVPKLPIPKVLLSAPNDFSTLKRKRDLRKIQEDASDGFEDADEEMPHYGREIEPIVATFTVINQTHGRAILPKPPAPKPNATAQTVLLPNGTLGSLIPVYPSRAELSAQLLRNVITIGPADKAPNPDEFRPPKRKRVIHPRKEETTESQPSFAVGKPQPRRKGRPSSLKKSAVALITEIPSDCLAVASDGLNLKCLACNCLLTKHGWGYSRQVRKHLEQIKSHRSRYETWKFGQSQNSGLPDLFDPGQPVAEVIRRRGRIKKTPLDYMAEFKSPWLHYSENGESLFCSACNIDLELVSKKGKRNIVLQHLNRDPVHLEKTTGLPVVMTEHPETSEVSNVGQMTEERQLFFEEVSEISSGLPN